MTGKEIYHIMATVIVIAFPSLLVLGKIRMWWRDRQVKQLFAAEMGRSADEWDDLLPRERENWRQQWYDWRDFLKADKIFRGRGYE